MSTNTLIFVTSAWQQHGKCEVHSYICISRYIFQMQQTVLPQYRTPNILNRAIYRIGFALCSVLSRSTLSIRTHPSLIIFLRIVYRRIVKMNPSSERDLFIQISNMHTKPTYELLTWDWALDDEKRCAKYAELWRWTEARSDASVKHMES